MWYYCYNSDSEVSKIDSEQHWKISSVKESGHMFGSTNLFSWPSREMSTIWEFLIKKKTSGLRLKNPPLY